MLFGSVALTVGLFLPGCGESGPTMGRVSGKVTYNGKPVAKGTVSFVSTEPARPNANSPIGPDGSYSLQTTNPNDGAVVGDYTVAVSGKDPNAVNNDLPGAPVKVTSDIPAKFEDPAKSGLKATVKSGSNDIPIDLK